MFSLSSALRQRLTHLWKECNSAGRLKSNFVIRSRKTDSPTAEKCGGNHRQKEAGKWKLLILGISSLLTPKMFMFGTGMKQHSKSLEK